MTRTFEDKPAVRERVPLMIGLMGPSGSGKTYSAMRLATGIQRVNGGDIFVVDTEARRALHYADRFKFRHLAFGAPFSPLDYLEAIEHCVNKGAKVIVVDSMSHEHEGPGGVLELHDQETQRLAKLWGTSTEKAKLSAWGPPKAMRRRMINTVLQLECDFIFCFRAKEKLLIKKGRDPEPRGFMPIAGEEFVYEMTLNALLLPNAGGVPIWHSDEIGEKQMLKLPEQFRSLLLGTRGPLSEDIGQELATWAAGRALGPGDYVIPESYSKAHAGTPLRQYDDDKLKFFVGHDKAPHALRDAARRLLEERAAPPNLVEDVFEAEDFDKETGEMRDEATA